MIRNRRGTWRSSISSTDEMLPSSAVIVFLAIASCVAGAPIQLLEGENIGLDQAIYSQPELTAALARTYDALAGEPDPRGLNVIRGGGGVHGGGRLMRQSRRGLDSLSGATFGESKRWDPPRKENEASMENSNWPNMMNRMEFDSSAKRNFDEIDRTNFDSFVKRNLDEIDRTGWDSFVKRRSMNPYLAASRQHR